MDRQRVMDVYRELGRGVILPGAVPRAAWRGGALLCLCVTGCVFETRDAVRIRPELAAGSEWMYQYRTWLKQEDGSSSDTARHFIRYVLEGDSILSGRSYPILSEEDLAIFNTDYGIVKNRSLYAIDTAGGAIRVGRLKDGALATGRLPFKASSEFRIPSDTRFDDTVHFEDAFTAMVNPAAHGMSWIYRESVNESGRSGALKVMLGREGIVLSGRTVAAVKFRILETEDDRFNIFEWYAGDIKVLSRTSYAANTFNRDSLHIEEEYLGSRSFTAADTAALLDDSRFPR